MDLETKKIDNDIMVIYLSGRLDVLMSVDIEKEIHKIIDRDKSHLLLNLGGVEYISSSGIRIFVSSMRILKNLNRKLKICNMNNAVKKIFEVVELMDMFEIYETEKEALQSFSD